MKEVQDIEIRRSTVGKFLREKRINAGITQQAVARKLKYSSAQFISNWERGLALPPLDVMPILGQLYGASPKEFIDVMHEYQDKLYSFQRQMVVDVFKRSKNR